MIHSSGFTNQILLFHVKVYQPNRFQVAYVFEWVLNLFKLCCLYVYLKMFKLIMIHDSSSSSKSKSPPYTAIIEERMELDLEVDSLTLLCTIQEGESGRDIKVNRPPYAACVVVQQDPLVPAFMMIGCEHYIVKRPQRKMPFLVNLQSNTLFSQHQWLQCQVMSLFG